MLYFVKLIGYKQMRISVILLHHSSLWSQEQFRCPWCLSIAQCAAQNEFNYIGTTETVTVKLLRTFVGVNLLTFLILV